MTIYEIDQAVTASKPPIVSLNRICKSYDGAQVLQDVNFTAHQGEVISIIGPSGAGKSTLLRIINLLEIPDSGAFTLQGEQILFKKKTTSSRCLLNPIQGEKLRRHIGMVFQNFNLWPHMTVLSNITEGSIRVLKEPKKQARERAYALLDKVGLTDKAHTYPLRLSGGQQQRVAIARTLAMQPKLILLDEPTSALDPELVAGVLQVIKTLAESGHTMILATHELNFARDVSTRVVFFDKGKLTEEGESQAIFDQPRSPRLRQFLTHH